MGQGVWIDSEKLSPTDEQREVLKHGTLTTGFIGLAECLVALTGQHHGQSAEAQRLGLEIVGHMRSYCDRISKERGMNYTASSPRRPRACPAASCASTASATASSPA